MKPFAPLALFTIACIVATYYDGPQADATPQPVTPQVTIETPVVVPNFTPDVQPPPLVPSVDQQDAIALAPATGDCPGGACAVPRAAVIRKSRITQVQKPQRRLFGGRIFGRGR